MTTRTIEWPVAICDACGQEAYPWTTLGPDDEHQVVLCFTCFPH